MQAQQQYNPINTGVGIFLCGMILLVIEMMEPGQSVRRLAGSGEGYPLAHYAWFAIIGGIITTSIGAAMKLFIEEPA
ncbi:MAG: hypothetical protein AAF456_20010 [Planctomycetota bacterium]